MNSTDMNNVINDWLNKADNIVSDYLRDGATITAKELNENLNNIKNGKTKVKTSLLLDHYDDFMERKRMQLVERENKSGEKVTARDTLKCLSRRDNGAYACPHEANRPLLQSFVLFNL